MFGKSSILILAGCLAVQVCAPVWAAHANRGRALYETQCRFCHESQVHLGPNRHVTTLEELQRRVRGWSVHAALGWSGEEVADVVEYLNQRFYHFPEPATD